MTRSAFSVRRSLAASLKRQSVRAGAEDPSVRGADWRLATVTTVGTDGTVTADGIPSIRCLDSYTQPAVGDLIAISQSSIGNWAALGRLAIGTDPVGGTRTVLRTADLPRSNTATPTADPQLTLPITANGVYDIDALVFHSGVNDILIGWSLPTGCAGRWGGLGNGTTVVSGTAGGGTQQDASSTWGYTLRTEATDITATRTYGGISTTVFTVQISGTLRVGATAGNAALSWSQGGSNATATTLHQDSWLRLHRVS